MTLLLYRTQFLVDLNVEKVGRVLKLDSIKQGNMWRGMDVLIFNSWHWWTHTEHIQPYVVFLCLVLSFLNTLTNLMTCVCFVGGITWKMEIDCTKT